MNALLTAYLCSLLSPADPRRDSPPEGLRNWIADLEHEDPGVRDSVRAYLLKVGAEAIPCLIELLREPSPELVRFAETTLLSIGPAAVPALQRAVASAQEPQRSEAAKVLQRLERTNRWGIAS